MLTKRELRKIKRVKSGQQEVQHFYFKGNSPPTSKLLSPDTPLPTIFVPFQLISCDCLKFCGFHLRIVTSTIFCPLFIVNISYRLILQFDLSWFSIFNYEKLLIVILLLKLIRTHYSIGLKQPNKY